MYPHQNIHSTFLPNGIKILLVENNTADIVSCRFFLKNAGARGNPLGKAGLANLLASVITKGTRHLSSQEIAEEVESVGASLGADAAADYFLLSLKTVAADFPQILQLTQEVMRFPTFPEQEVELEQYLTLQDIRSQKEQPFSLAFQQLRDSMYGEHPYGYSVLGSEASLSQLSREDLKNFHHTYFRPDNLVVSISGRITLEQAKALLEEVFGDWQVPDVPLSPPQIPTLATTPGIEKIPQDTQQSIIMLGYLASSVYQEDYFALKLLNTYLGNGLSSRLFVELREKRGLAYDVSAFYPTRIDASQFVTYMGTAPENTAIALEGLAKEAKRLCEVELSLEEVQAAKNKLLGQYALGKQTNAEIAQIFGWYETIELGVDFDLKFQERISQLSPAILQEVAKRYLQQPYISLVGPEAALAI